MKKTKTKTKTTTKAAKTTTSKAATKAAGRATLPASAPKAAKVAKGDATERKPSRRDAIVALVSRPNGATLPEIMEATGWQKHSVRGMMSVLGKTMKIASSKNDAGERTYIANAPKAAKPKTARPAAA
jgi:hypothetical protein